MIVAKRPVKRYADWKRNVTATSTFVVVCGFVAVTYFFYRLVLVAAPIVAIEQSVFNPTSKVPVVCKDDEGSKLQYPQPLLSLAYQNRIQQQKPITSNSVSNASLSRINDNTGDPTGYSHSVDDNDASYEYLTDSDGTKFLRVINMKQRSAGQLSPAWEMDPVTISPNMKTYSYSFWYRSTVPVHVSTEYTVNNQTQYEDVMTLDATGMSWKQFTAHFDNNDKATTFRVDINSVGVGQVDSRGLDVHEIADAKLNKGIVTVTFDDGWQSVKDNALPLLKKYGIRSTQYIITDVAARKVAGYMTYDEIAKLKAAGQEIGSHTLTHCDQTELSPSLLEDNAVKSKQALEQQKLGPIKTFAYPLGEYNKKTQAVYEKQYSLIRTSITGYNDRYYDETNIHSMAIVNDTSDAAFESWISYAQTHHLWLVLTYHRVDETGEYSISSKQLERQLKMIQKSGMNVMPMSEAAVAARQ